MRVLVTLYTPKNTRIPVNYKYNILAGIYSKLQSVNPQEAERMHEKHKHDQQGLFIKKLFTFSDIIAPCRYENGFLYFKSNTAKILYCFYENDMAELFIKGIFNNQSIRIGSTVFGIDSVNILPDKTYNSTTLKLLSPVHLKKNSPDIYEPSIFISPTDNDFCYLIRERLKSKYIYLNGYDKADDVFENVHIEKSISKIYPRLYDIKGIQIKGYLGVDIKIHAPPDIIHIALHSGIGQTNTNGFGCVIPEQEII